MKQYLRSPLSLLILLGVLWGSGYSLARYATTHGVAPLGYAFWQSLGPALLLSLYILFKRAYQGLRLRYLPFPSFYCWVAWVF